MPTYDYYCEQCDLTEEHFHGMNETPIILCEKCNKKMKKKISAGSGFIMRDGGTKSHRQRHGRKKRKSENLPTPSEAARELALKQAKDIGKTHDPNNPYKDFK